MRGKSLERSKGLALGSCWAKISADDSSLGSLEVKSNVPMDFFKSWDKFLEPNSTLNLTNFKNQPDCQKPFQPNHLNFLTQSKSNIKPKRPNHKTKLKREKPKLRRVRSRSVSEIEAMQPVTLPINPIMKNPYVAPPTQIPTCPSAPKRSNSVVPPELPVTQTTTFEKNILDSSIPDSGKH